MHRFLLDTNILIHYLHGSDATFDPFFHAFEQGKITFLCSLVSEYEMLGYPEITNDEEAAIASLLSTLEVIPVDRRIITTAALLRRRYHKKPLDLFITATALVHDIPLITKNLRDFQRIDGLTVFKTPPSFSL